MTTDELPQTLTVTLSSLAELAGADSHAARRVFGHAASKLLSLAVSFQEAGRIAEALFVCRAARSVAPPDAEELPAIEAKLRALGEGEARGERGWEEYAGALARELAEARAPKNLFRDDPRGEKTLDSFKVSDDGAGCLTSVAFWVTIAAACFMLQWCGVIKTRTPRAPIYSPPPFNGPNLNFNVNLNYNVAPLNLSPYTEPSPRGTTTPRGRRRRQSRGEVFDIPPPLIAPVAPPVNAPARPANRNAPPR